MTGCHAVTAGYSVSVAGEASAAGAASAIGCRTVTTGCRVAAAEAAIGGTDERAPGDAGASRDVTTAVFPVAGTVNGVDVIGYSKSCKKSYVCREGVGDVEDAVEAKGKLDSSNTT